MEIEKPRTHLAIGLWTSHSASSDLVYCLPVAVIVTVSEGCGEGAVYAPARWELTALLRSMREGRNIQLKRLALSLVW